MGILDDLGDLADSGADAATQVVTAPIIATKDAVTGVIDKVLDFLKGVVRMPIYFVEELIQFAKENWAFALLVMSALMLIAYIIIRRFIWPFFSAWLGTQRQVLGAVTQPEALKAISQGATMGATGGAGSAIGPAMAAGG